MRIVRDFCVIWLCVLVVLLPGCSALLPWMSGRDADVDAIHTELEGYKQHLTDLQGAVKKMDTNQDGKLTLTEGLVGAGATLLGAVYGTNRYRDSQRKKRGEQV